MKRLKIAQQIAIVLFLSVLIPFITIGLIISNISQQSIRKELKDSATMLSAFLGDSVQNYLKYADEELKQIASAISFFYEEDKNDFLDEVRQKYGKFNNFQFINAQSLTKRDPSFNPKKSVVKLYANIDDLDIISADLKMDILQDALDNHFTDIKHDVYILDDIGNIIATNDHDNKGYNDIVENLPKEREYNTPVLFSKVKNQPLAYYQMKSPNWTIVVKTTPNVTKKTIDVPRLRIILSLVFAALFIFAAAGIYTYYLYLNIRQLFKGIIAISKGSYNRKIRLLKSVFTPHEIVFLEKEFNYMTKKVASSYTELSEKNLELKRLDEFRASLVSAISHEFRTPLTSIIGYSSRLLRSDIKVDDETRLKSLRVIKQQAQRLSGMVDDLLVIPEIESFKLQLNNEKLDLAKLLELTITYANYNDSKFIVNSASDLLPVLADNDRLIQVLVNLFDNAIKYNKGKAPIVISAANVDGKPCLSILNKSEIIPEDKLEKLFDKFVRLDSELTRTTRGTGLGLFIVKGLEVVLVFNNEPKQNVQKTTDDKTVNTFVEPQDRTLLESQLNVKLSSDKAGAVDNLFS